MTARLGEGERDALLRVSRAVLDGDVEPTSVSAYGSKVAGYARADSDYDIIVTVSKFRGRVRYRYVEEPVNASALIVEDRAASEDAARASLGEFVAGRLLNVYEPLLNGGFVRRMELEYKRRVIAESLIELASEHGEFTQDIVIPLEYFLFDKLHKRAAIYPPALYSYVRTYTCDRGPENRDFSLSGFREAALTLEEQGLVTVRDDDGGSVKVVGEKLRGNALARLVSALNLTTRGMRQYAVHGYAGRVGFGVFKDEAISKLRRMKEKVDPPRELQNPRRLLRLDEGVVFENSQAIYDELARMHGLGEGCEFTEEGLGQVYSTTRMVRTGGPPEMRFVLKHFADIRSMKWALLGLWASERKFSMSPQSRLHREYSAMRRLREMGIETPRVLGVALKEKTLVREYVDGVPLSQEVEEALKGRSSEMRHIALYGALLARVHEAGYALGDAKAGNVIVQGDRLVLADLEQSIEGGDTAWDVAEFLYYTAKLSRREEGMRVVAEEFLRGYGSTEDAKGTIARARAPKYLAPFRPFLAPQMVRSIREAMAASFSSS